MGSSNAKVRPAKVRQAVFRRLWWSILLGVLLVTAASILFINRMDASTNELLVGPDMVVVRYRFVGEVVTHYVSGVAAITEFRRPEALDALVLNLKTGKDYVVNADKLVDYRLAANTTVEKRTELNKLYYHYDPYLQGEKQGWHKEWADAEYSKWVNRPPTEQEWLEILNEVTRGVEHPQMARWIQYSPPAMRRFLEKELEAAFGHAPSETDIQPYYQRLLAGESYEAVSEAIHAEADR